MHLTAAGLLLAIMLWSEVRAADPLLLTPSCCQRMIVATRHLGQPLARPEPGDWLASFPEKGQSFRQYIGLSPVRPDRIRRKICLQPLGAFSPARRKILRQVSAYLEVVFGLPAEVRPAKPTAGIPGEARRRLPDGTEQLLTSYLLFKLLKPDLPPDAAIQLGFTSNDLWPGGGWNYVFGQASLQDRTGIYSLHRFGDPAAGAAAERLCLLRTLKIAVHESGHMFSLLHCTAHECVMNGCNHLPELDRHPLYFCPECLAKICWAVRREPAELCKHASTFLKAAGLPGDAAYYGRVLAVLQAGGFARSEASR